LFLTPIKDLIRRLKVRKAMKVERLIREEKKYAEAAKTFHERRQAKFEAHQAEVVAMIAELDRIKRE